MVRFFRPWGFKSLSIMENTTSSTRLLVGLFRDRDNAEQAYDGLKEKGYTDDEINVLMSSDTRSRYFGDDDNKDKDDNNDLGKKSAEGAGVGSAIGGTIGAIVGAVAAIGTNLLLPGVGLVVAGPLAAALAGAGAGGLTGGIIGALVGMGIPEDRAKIYHEGLKNGRILISVVPHSDEDAAKIAEAWRACQAEEVSS